MRTNGARASTLALVQDSATRPSGEGGRARCGFKSATFCFGEGEEHSTKRAHPERKRERNPWQCGIVMSSFRSIPESGPLLLLFVLHVLCAGLGLCAPRGKGGGSRGGTVANKAVVGKIASPPQSDGWQTTLHGALQNNAARALPFGRLKHVRVRA